MRVCGSNETAWHGTAGKWQSSDSFFLSSIRNRCSKDKNIFFFVKRRRKSLFFLFSAGRSCAAQQQKATEGSARVKESKEEIIKETLLWNIPGIPWPIHWELTCTNPEKLLPLMPRATMTRNPSPPVHSLLATTTSLLTCSKRVCVCIPSLSRHTAAHSSYSERHVSRPALGNHFHAGAPSLSLSLPTAVLCNELSSAEETEESRALKQKKN